MLAVAGFSSDQMRAYDYHDSRVCVDFGAYHALVAACSSGPLSVQLEALMREYSNTDMKPGKHAANLRLQVTTVLMAVFIVLIATQIVTGRFK